MDLGLGRRSLEEQIQEEVGCLKKELEMCDESWGVKGVCGACACFQKCCRKSQTSRKTSSTRRVGELKFLSPAVPEELAL